MKTIAAILFLILIPGMMFAQERQKLEVTASASVSATIMHPEEISMIPDSANIRMMVRGSLNTLISVSVTTGNGTNSVDILSSPKTTVILPGPKQPNTAIMFNYN